MDTKGAKSELVARFKAADKVKKSSLGVMPVANEANDMDEEGSGSADELDLAEMFLSGSLVPTSILARTPKVGHAGNLPEMPPAPLPSEVQVKKRARRSATVASPLSVTPGISAAIAALGPVVTAVDADAEKRRADEGRNVEHVALHDDDTQALATKPSQRRRVKK